MYRVTIVDGPNRGSSFMIHEGENSIGRQTGNAIVLQSARVSKQHCVLEVDGEGKIVLKDQGSSNGTFVNGVLAKRKEIAAGDRISVGEYILEIDKPTSKKPKAPLPVHGLGGGIAIPGISTPSARKPSPATAFPDAASAGPPADLKGKASWILDKKVMPFFYGLNIKYEWNLILIAFFGAFIAANLVVSVQPLLESGRKAVVREAATRARFIARMIADRNAPHFAARAETKMEIDPLIEKADGVHLAVLVDMENRILAPRRTSGFLTDGPEAVLALNVRQRFERRDTGVIRELREGMVTAIEPVLVFDSGVGRNLAVGMAVVTVDTSLSTPDIGEMGVLYSKTIILTGLVGALILFVLYRMTLRPFEVLADDMDKVLKGDLMRITREHKFSELTPLWDLVDSTLQRVPKGTNSMPVGDHGPAIEDLVGPVQMLGDFQKQGIAICDSNRAVLYLNQPFEDITGIRSEMAIGQTLASAARDQSFAALMGDLLDRAASVGSAVDDCDFSGVAYKLHVSCFPGPGGQPRGFVIAAERQEA